jgi:hypothetical protein
MGATGFFLTAATALSAGTKLMEGQQAKKESEYNASILREKAAMLDVKKDIETAKYTKLRGRAWSTAMANVAAMGIQPSGSAMAVMLRVQKEIAIDEAIARYNIDTEKGYTMAEASAQERAGKRAMNKGYMGAFTSILKGAYVYNKEIK